MDEDIRMYTDEQLVVLLRDATSKDALLVLFDRYSEELYGFILEQTDGFLLSGVFSNSTMKRDTAATLVVSIFTNLWDNRESALGQESIREYLIDCACSKLDALPRTLKKDYERPRVFQERNSFFSRFRKLFG